MSNVKPGILAGSIIFIVSLFMFIVAFQYPYSSAIGPGPGFFPVWISGILMVLSILYIVESVREKNESEESWPTKKSLKGILFIMMSLFLFVLLFSLAGFILAGVVMMYLLFYKEYKWYTNLSMSVGITFLIYGIFNYLLEVHLPSGGILF